MSIDLDEALFFADSELPFDKERTRAALKRLAGAVRWYRLRCEALQVAQKHMRDPERKVVCDILANGRTYENLPDETQTSTKETGTFFVTGSHGEIEVNAKTGEPVSVVHTCDCEHCQRPGAFSYSQYRYDVDEWRRHYPGEEMEGNSVDIMDLGTWEPGGSYVPAEQDWRDEYRKRRAEDDRKTL